MSSDRDKRLSAIEDLLLANPQGLRLTDIVKLLAIHRSTISRDFIELEQQGVLLWEDENGRYGIYQKKSQPKESLTSTKLDEPINKMKALLQAQDCEEAKYQRLFQEYPWMLGISYKEIKRHQKLDDENIPDFVGIRVFDNLMDIFEIKHPFIKVLLRDGKFSADFNDSWNQAERYLDFARIETDYLRRKGLNFDNPKCTLIIGFDIPEEGLRRIRAKQRMNPSIQVFTYNDVLTIAEAVIGLAKHLTS